MTERDYILCDAALRGAAAHYPGLSWAARACLLGLDLAALVERAQDEAMLQRGEWWGLCAFCGTWFTGRLVDRTWQNKAFGASCPRCHWINAPAAHALEGLGAVETVAARIEQDHSGSVGAGCPEEAP